MAGYAPTQRAADFAASEPMFTTWPRFFSKCGTAARVQRTSAMRFNSIRSRNCSGVVSSTLPRIDRPALFTSTSKRPNRSKRLGEQPIDVFLLRDIGTNAQHLAAGRLHFLLRAGDGLGLEADDRQFRSRPGEMLGDDAAQSARSAGHQNDFVLPIIHGV